MENTLVYGYQMQIKIWDSYEQYKLVYLAQNSFIQSKYTHVLPNNSATKPKSVNRLHTIAYLLIVNNATAPTVPLVEVHL